MNTVLRKWYCRWGGEGIGESAWHLRCVRADKTGDVIYTDPLHEASWVRRKNSFFDLKTSH
jgi:hypothetical protein